MILLQMVYVLNLTIQWPGPLLCVVLESKHCEKQAKKKKKKKKNKTNF